MTLAERFWKKVNKTSTCWLWTASTFSNGYGQFGIPGKNALAHRVAYELLVGPIPPNMELDHTCEVHRCVNPAHLEVVTRRENQLRSDGIARRNSLKTECLNGHPLAGSNLRINSRGDRVCKTCDARRARDYRKRASL